MLRLSLALAAAVVLAACQNPNEVGLGLIDDAGDDPQARIVNAATTDTLQATVPTAGYSDAALGVVQARVLVGAVTDPVYGDATAVGTFDATRPSPVPEDFADSTIVGIQLRLVRDYVYGETTTEQTFELRAVEGAWTPVGLPPDTTLGTGDVLATATVSALDDEVVFDLPQSYVAANDTTFTSTSFASSFEGFTVALPDGAAAMPGAVLGFSSARSEIRAITSGRDTVSFPVAEVYTRLTRGAPGPEIPARLLLQGGAPTGLTLTFGFDDLAALPLARARFKLPLDPSLAGDEGTFRRPRATAAALFARTGETRTLLASLAPPDTTNITSLVTLPSSNTLTGQIQQVLLGNTTIDRFELGLPSTPLSLDVLPIITEPLEGAPAPRFLLTVVGGNV